MSKINNLAKILASTIILGTSYISCDNLQGPQDGDKEFISKYSVRAGNQIISQHDLVGEFQYGLDSIGVSPATGKLNAYMKVNKVPLVVSRGDWVNIANDGVSVNQTKNSIDIQIDDIKGSFTPSQTDDEIDGTIYYMY